MTTTTTTTRRTSRARLDARARDSSRTPSERSERWRRWRRRSRTWIRRRTRFARRWGRNGWRVCEGRWRRSARALRLHLPSQTLQPFLPHRRAKRVRRRIHVLERRLHRLHLSLRSLGVREESLARASSLAREVLLVVVVVVVIHPRLGLALLARTRERARAREDASTNVIDGFSARARTTRAIRRRHRARADDRGRAAARGWGGTCPGHCVCIHDESRPVRYRRATWRRRGCHHGNMKLHRFKIEYNTYR